jgi:hypothetical protein
MSSGFRVAVACLLSTACAGAEDAAPDSADANHALCDGRALSEASDLTTTAQLVALGYAGVASVPSGVDPGALTGVVTTDAAWGELIDTLQTDAALSPDFGADAVFVHGWVDGGCEPAFAYTVHGWDAGRTIRARGVQDGVDEGCDAYFPTLALLLVPGAAGADLGWCLVEATRAAPY